MKSSSRISPGWIGSSRLVTILAPSVRVGDLNVEGISITPNKADSPLVVDPDAVLPFAVPFQFLQPIPRRHAQILERHRSGAPLALVENGWPRRNLRVGC